MFICSLFGLLSSNVIDTFLFKNATSLREMVSKLPIDRILVETDSPYLTPDPFRGKRNEPCYVEYVAKMVAEIKGVSYEDIVKITNENTKRAFEMEAGV